MPPLSSTTVKLLSSLASMSLVGILAAQAPEEWDITSSSPTDPTAIMSAVRALDGDMTTRWSSAHEDDHWMAIDFGKPTEVVGVRIHWETAYGRDYDIELSDDGTHWTTASVVREGDGGFDEVYFGPRTARHLRMKGIRRGTGWGFSIWEMKILGPEFERAFKSSFPEETDLTLIMDGSPDTALSFEAAEGGWIEVTLPEVTRFGGVQLTWKDGASAPWRLSTRNEADESWTVIANSPGATDAVEEVYFDQAAASWLRLEVDGDRDSGAHLAEFTLKGPDEAWNPARHFEMIARRTSDGAFPRWLRREQGYWTVVAEPRTHLVSLLDEDGRVEVRIDGFSITPALMIDGELIGAKSAEVTQSLEDGWAPLPTVEWKLDDLTLRVDVQSGGKDLTDVRYTVMNTSEADPGRDVALLLAVRPLQINPPWQRGGFSPIRSAMVTGEGAGMTLNEEEILLLHPAPTNAGAMGREEADVLEYLATGKQLSDEAVDEDGLVSAGARFDLGAARHAEVFMRLRLSEGAEASVPENFSDHFARHRVAEVERWRELTGDWSITTPDPRLENFVRSNLAYLLINMDGSAIQPGTRNYEHSWIRDGSISATSMILFGMEEPVRDYVRWFSHLVHDTGFVPFIVRARTGEMPDWTSDWAEYDSFGQFAYLVREYYEHTGDRETLDLAWPKVKAALDHASEIRRERLTVEWEGTEFEGILPRSNSHEGYFPAQHSYWDDFTLLRGYDDGVRMANLVGDAEAVARFQSEGAALRIALMRSIERVRERDGLKIIPASADLGDFDPTSTSIGIMFGDERDNLDPDALVATYDRYLEDVRIRHSGERESSYTAYEARTVGALLRLDRRAEALWLLDTLLKDATRPAGWNHMGEVTHPDTRMPSYIGDMPHTWIGSGVIHAIRDLFVYEDRGELVIGAGIHEDWWEAGVEVRNLGTWWGEVTFTAGLREGKRVIQLKTEAEPPAGFRVVEGTTLLR